MGKWQGAWYLAKHELKNIRWKHLLTLVFIFYFVVMTAPTFSSAMKESGYTSDLWGLDFITLGLLPWIGLMGIQSSGMSWKNSIFSDKIVYWRTLPITVLHIARSRVLALLVNTVSSLIVAFTLSAIATSYLLDNFHLGAYALLASFMIGLSICIGLIFLLLEAALSHKVYSILCFVNIFVYMAVLLIYTNISKTSIILYIYKTAVEGFWYWPIIGFAAAGLAIILILPLVENRIKNRDLFNV